MRKTPSMDAATADFSRAYARAFLAFLYDKEEPNLRAAYELGRDAVSRSFGLLDLANVHHQALVAELEKSTRTDDVRRITVAAADFMMEVLSAYEMVRRGFAEARDVVASERRQARMLQQLSSLLADTSLAVGAHSSVEEMLQLVVEQTRELTAARWCIAGITTGSGDPSPVAHTGDPDSAVSDLTREAFAAVATETDPTRVIAVHTPSTRAGVNAVVLTALDGDPIGVLAVAESPGRPLTELDRAVLVHVGQMTAAALERATRYRVDNPHG